MPPASPELAENTLTKPSPKTNADAELDALVRRDARVALGHAVLQFDRAAHGVDNATELDDQPVTGALDHAAVVEGDRRVDGGRCAARAAAQACGPRPRPRAG